MMHDLDGTYAQAYNERHKTTGCLFQGTFKSMWVRDLEGLVYVSRYIHVNCRDLKIRPDRYRWSSYRSYLGLEPVPAWLETRAVLDYWKDDSKPVEQSYRDYVDAAPPPRHRSKRKGAEWGDFWVDYVRHLEERCVEWSIPLAAWLGRTSLQSFVCWVAQRVFDIPPRWVAEFYGLENGRAVVARSSRFQERVDQEPELGLALESVVKW
jgi:hypothetical protein